MVGSGIATVSASSLRARPSMTAPSKLAPEFNTCSSSSMVMAKPLTDPRMSVNQSRMKRTSCWFAERRTNSVASSSAVLFGVVGVS